MLFYIISKSKNVIYNMLKRDVINNLPYVQIRKILSYFFIQRLVVYKKINKKCFSHLKTCVHVYISVSFLRKGSVPDFFTDLNFGIFNKSLLLLNTFQQQRILMFVYALIKSRVVHGFRFWSIFSEKLSGVRCSISQLNLVLRNDT